MYAEAEGHRPIQRHLMQYTRLTPEIQSTLPSDRFISPFEVELVRFEATKSIGGEYRAKWLDADVVVKLFVQSSSVFEAEVDMWHQLRHPNIIKLYGACDLGYHFFVCEYASRGSLVEFMKSCDEKTRTPWKYLLEAAMGLEYLHERGIVHGNLRGSSILIGNDGKAKLAEFGLSGSATCADTAASRLGSTRWQAPECLKGEPASLASDVYSFGLCVIETVTRTLLWDGDRDETVEMKKLSWNPSQFKDDWRKPAVLTSELCKLVPQLCSLYPEERILAASVVRMLEPLAAKETAQHGDEEAEPEVVNMATYRNGELPDQWNAIRDQPNIHEAEEKHQYVIRGLEKIFTLLQQSDRLTSFFKRFHDLILELKSTLETGGLENRVYRLSATRAAGDRARVFLREITLLLAELDDSESTKQMSRWSEYRAHQVELFVTDKSWWSLNNVETDEDRLELVTFLKSEIEVHGTKYSAKQLKAMQQAFDDISSKSDLKLQAKTPQWFIPWFELIVKKHQPLGRGGYGAVYRAKWLDSEVVVKELTVIVGGDSIVAPSFLSRDSKSRQTASKTDDPKAKAAREEMRRMFEREVEIWFGLNHPHVVRLFGACHVGTPFFVCEYATNGSLDKYLRHHPDELWSKLHEAALGILYLHERGIFHGDLKCNNIVVGSDGRAKVTDFGLSAAQSGEVHGKVSGAVQWVAPECLKEGESHMSADSDVYSFGMCIVEAMRVVEAKRLKKNKKDCPPYPWGVLGPKVVKLRALKGEPPLRPSPQVCLDSHWSLVERMCKLDPKQRLKITTVADELAALARSGAAEQVQTPVVLGVVANVLTSSEIKPISARRGSVVGAEGEHSLLRGVYHLLRERLDDVSGQVTAGSAADEQLRSFDARVQIDMAAAERCSDSLTEFTEAALHAYALHRQLDKLMAANFLEATEDDNVHAWKPKCQELMEVQRAPTAA